MTVHTMLDKRNDFYKKAVDALNHNYGASLAYTYQSTRLNQLWWTSTFDFSLLRIQPGNLRPCNGR